jgi:septal ring factor EnvC (AmiA/AmiB activator)
MTTLPVPFIRSHRRARVGAALLVAGLAFAGLAFAADDNPAARRDREQLQRTRSALKETTAQRDALQAEKAAWEAERQGLKSEAARSKGSERALATLRQQVQLCDAHAQQQNQDLSAVRASLTQAEQQAQEREAALRQQLQVSQREASERAVAVRATAQLLESSTADLQRATNANRQLHAAGLQAIASLRLEWQAQETPLLDPLGLAAVRHENALVSLREALDKARLALAH